MDKKVFQIPRDTAASTNSVMPKIDEIDQKIIVILVKDARISYSQLAEKVGMSRVRIKERVTELQRKGIIERFTIQVPARFLGKPLPVFFDVGVRPRNIVTAAQKIAEYPDIVIVYQMSGQNALHIHGFFRDMEDVSFFVNDFVSQIEGVTSVAAEFLLKRYKADRSLMV